MKRCVKSFIICRGCLSFYYRMMKINMSTMEMLCMQPVYVGLKSVKDTCLSKLSIVCGGFYSIPLMIC
jgi:hypothetical protein